MFRIIFILLVVLMVSLLYLQSRTMQTSSEKPIFLRTDEIANTHSTNIELKIHSHYLPVESEQETLKKDYSNIWAHLNHLYNTNDVETGKEYYTEGWFRQICSYNIKKILTPVIRNDLQHALHIQNWENDGLICTVIDSNVVFKYTFPDSTVQTTKANLAMVLLYQGDHWRIDALRVINELKN
jgi:hypothetical protein